MNSIRIVHGKGTGALKKAVHEYLKKLGYKSCLYSSCKVDSPATFISPDNGVEISFKSEDDLLDIIEACEAYEADFLVLDLKMIVLHILLIWKLLLMMLLIKML